MQTFFSDIALKLSAGQIGVIPTDTVYGLVGPALDREAVERIYRTRKRNPGKPCIILISSYDDLKKFNVEISAEMRKKIENLWPGKVSIIFSCTDERFDYLARGTQSLAFRMPDWLPLRELLSQTGPLVATSANKGGEATASSIAMAKNIFGDSVDFYVDGGELSTVSSTLVRFEGENIVVLREGAVRIV